MMERDNFVIYMSHYQPIKRLTMEQRGRLLTAMFEYHLQGTVDVDDDIGVAFDFFKAQFDVNDRKYAEKVARWRENGRKGGRPKTKENQMVFSETKQNLIAEKSIEEKSKEEKSIEEMRKEDKEKESKKQKATPFVPPTLAQVKEYVEEKGLKMDAEHFYDHFTSNGWRVSGKATMKDWRAAVRNWARNEPQYARQGASRGQGTSVGERAYNMLHFEYEGHPEMWVEEQKRLAELQKDL